MPDLKAPNQNLVLLAGRLVADPELRYTPKGTAVCSFRMAVSKYYRDRNSGEFKEETSFFNFVAWDAAAERAAERLHKGSPCMVEGSLKSRSYEDKDGNKRYIVEIVCRHIQFLEKADDNAQSDEEKLKEQYNQPREKDDHGDDPFE